MGRKLVPKVILEGTRLTHKTDVAFALNEHPRFVGPKKYRYHSPIISGEWCAFTNHPWGRGLINFNADEEAKALETYKTWVRLFELQRYYSWTIDRFHLSTMVVQQRERNRELDFRWLEEGLVNLNFRLILLTRAPESFVAAREERLKVSGKPSQYDDLQTFIEEQEQFRKLLKQTKLQHIEIDISDDNVTAACDRICDWMDDTGGLYLDE